MSKPTTHIAHIALGSNLNDRRATLRKAVQMMDDIEGISVLQVSSLIETSPVGGPAGQSDYLNAAAELATVLEPHELLERLGEIEDTLGRDRAQEQRWGSRTCDLDILLIEDAVLDDPQLVIPHPRMHERLFVLEPLAEISPGAMHPKLGKTVAELLEDCRKNA